MFTPVRRRRRRRGGHGDMMTTRADACHSQGGTTRCDDEGTVPPCRPTLQCCHEKLVQSPTNRTENRARCFIVQVIAWRAYIGHIQAPMRKIKGRVVYVYSCSVHTLHIALNMFTTCLENGRYTITASSGPVGTKQDYLVVEYQQNFYLQRQGRRGDDTYAIYPDNGGSVQQAPNWRLHVERGVTPQLWVMKQYHNQANTYTITQAGTDPSLGWIDNGHGKQLHLTVLDPNNVVLQQRYKIVRA
ncbi:hypothetical protein J3A83DRAFT_2535565 [Scleroderma citrinum]